MKKKNEFIFTAISDNEAFIKNSKLARLQDKCEQLLNISKYSDTINRITFVFLVLSDYSEFKEENFLKYNQAKKCFEIGVNIGYLKASTLKDWDLYKMLSEELVNALRKLDFMDIFDSKKFIKDIDVSLLAPASFLTIY